MLAVVHVRLRQRPPRYPPPFHATKPNTRSRGALKKIFLFCFVYAYPGRVCRTDTRMALPGPSVLRVWDCLFVDGHVVLFRVALALLKAIEGELGLATVCLLFFLFFRSAFSFSSSFSSFSFLFVMVLAFVCVRARACPCSNLDVHGMLWLLRSANLTRPFWRAQEMEDAMMALQRAKTLEIQTVLQIANGCQCSRLPFPRYRTAHGTPPGTHSACVDAGRSPGQRGWISTPMLAQCLSHSIRVLHSLVWLDVEGV